jgi:hypothetical protein
MKGDPTVIEFLNDGLRHELTSITARFGDLYPPLSEERVEYGASITVRFGPDLHPLPVLHPA